MLKWSDPECCRGKNCFVNGTPSALYDAILNGMHGMTSVAHDMMCLAIDGDPGGAHGAPSFEWVTPPLPV